MEKKSQKRLKVLIIAIISIILFVAVADSFIETNKNKLICFSVIQSVIINAGIFYFFNKNKVKYYLLSVIFLSASIYFIVFHFLDFFTAKHQPDYYPLFIPMSWVLCGVVYLLLLKMLFKINNVRKTILIASLLYIPFSFFGIIVYDVAFIMSWTLITLAVFTMYLNFLDDNIK
jgi:hypothetical protein